MAFDFEYALLSMQRALLQIVTPTLRAVCVDFSPESEVITYHFFYDGKITEELFDLACCAATEASAAFPANYQFERNIEELDSPKNIPSNGAFAYLRKEKSIPVFKNEPVIEDLTPTVTGDFLFPMQKALLGKVTPSLRAITIDFATETREFVCSFFYDGKITQELYDLANQAANEVSASFNRSFSLKLNVIQIDFPKKIPRAGRFVFERLEKNEVETK